MSSDLSSFVKPVPEEVNKTVDPEPTSKKKRKKSDGRDTELEDMRKLAKSYCSCFEQYNSIRRYSKQRLADWLEQKEFEVDHNLKNSVFSFVQQAYAFVLDKLTKGDGHVQNQIANDLTLRQSLEDEGRNLLQYLSNKSKILVLTSADVYHGKSEQREKQSKKERQVLPVSDVEQNMQVASSPLSSDSEGQASFHFDLRPEGQRQDCPPSEVAERQEGMEEPIRRNCDHVSDFHVAADLGDDQSEGGHCVSPILDNRVAADHGESNC